jgi:hypothetical protein
MFPALGNIFVHIPDSDAAAQYNTKSGEKIFDTNVDLLQSQFIT